MNGWSSKDVTLNAGRSRVGIVTDSPISLEGWPITAGGATTGFVAKVKVSGVTIVGGITAKLQTAIGDDWQDSKTVSVTATGIFYIKLLPTVAGDQAFLPLLNKGRIVVTTTNAGDTFTVDEVQILQEL